MMCGISDLTAARSDPNSMKTPTKARGILKWGAVLDPTARTGRGVTAKQGTCVGENRSFQGLAIEVFRNLRLRINISQMSATVAYLQNG